MAKVPPYRDPILPESFLRWLELLRNRLRAQPDFFEGSGSPEGALTATRGARYFNTTGTSGTWLYVKTTVSGNTGWVAYA